MTRQQRKEIASHLISTLDNRGYLRWNMTRHDFKCLQILIEIALIDASVKAIEKVTK